MSLVVGVTGGIGSGKTTVANCFHAQFGIPIVDTDIIARQVVEANTFALKKITERFGESILLEDGSLNRRQLREKIFSNEADKRWLNALLHPLINQQTAKELNQSTAPYTLCVIPLLVENNLQQQVDRVLVVDVSVEQQIQRTCARDEISKHQVESILEAQVSREERLKHADDVIVNDSDEADLLKKVEALHQHYLELAQLGSTKAKRFTKN